MRFASFVLITALGIAQATALDETQSSAVAALVKAYPNFLELIDGSAKTLFTMQEEHQLSPGEYITPGPPRAIFNGICGGCHGASGPYRATSP